MALRSDNPAHILLRVSQAPWGFPLCLDKMKRAKQVVLGIELVLITRCHSEGRFFVGSVPVALL